MFARSAKRAWSRRRIGAVIALGLIDLALGGAAAIELRTLDVNIATAHPAAAQPAPSLPALEAFALAPIETLKAVTERPLFARNRRPFAPAAPVASGDAAAFVLSGITLDGAQRTALVRHGTPPRLTRLGEGQEIDGWMVRAIAADRVELTNRAADYTLYLYKPAAKP